MPFSVLILTHNEQANIARCLEALRSHGSLSAGIELAVLDSGSTDDTVAIVERHGVPVYRRPFDTFARQRNWGAEQIPWKHDWILHLDADECVSREFLEEVEAVTSDEQMAAYLAANRLWFMGRWIRHASMFPRYQARLLRRGRARFVDRGHGQYLDPSVTAVGTLRTPYDHHNFSKGISEWVEKHNRYSTAEAGENLRRAASVHGRGSNVETRQQRVKRLTQMLPCRPLLRFLYLYVWRCGFLDGRPGFIYCVLVAFYQFLIGAKEYELRSSGSQAGSSPGPASSSGAVG